MKVLNTRLGRLAVTLGVAAAIPLTLASTASAQVQPAPPSPSVPCANVDCQPLPAQPSGKKTRLWAEASFACVPVRGVNITVGNGKDSTSTATTIYAASEAFGPISVPLTGVSLAPGQETTFFVPAANATGSIVVRVWGFDAHGRQLPFVGSGSKKVDCTCPDTPTTTVVTTVPPTTPTVPPSTPDTTPATSSTPTTQLMGILPPTGGSDAPIFAGCAALVAGLVLLLVARKSREA